MRTDRPVKLKIGYRDYTVRFVNKLPSKGQVGECELAETENISGKIRIKKGMEPVEKANTILHEILHAIWYAQGIGLCDKTEERIVSAITNGLIDFIRQNPKYARKLLALLKP